MVLQEPHGWVLVVPHPWVGGAATACVSPFAASHAGGWAGLPGKDGDAAVSMWVPAMPGACPAAGTSPGISLSLDRADGTASGCFPGGSFQVLCKLLTGKWSNLMVHLPVKLLPSLS